MYASASSQKGLYPGWDKDLHYAVRCGCLFLFTCQ